MKAILLSIQPKHLVNILNSEKTLEIRKSVPVGFKGWVYLYCTKAKPYLYYTYEAPFYALDNSNESKDEALNGKILARFWLDLVEDVLMHDAGDSFINEFEPVFCTNTLDYQSMNKLSCLSHDQLFEYQGMEGLIYAWHIKNLEIFDEPKELSELYEHKFYQQLCSTYNFSKENEELFNKNLTLEEYIKCFDKYVRIKRAPQSWAYVEVVE